MGGTICPVGPNVWGPDVGDRMSGDHMRSGPNASQPKSRPIPWQNFELVPLSLCPGTRKKFLSLCPKKLRCPVPLETLVSMDKWSPTNAVPLYKWSLEYFVVQGDRLWGSRNRGTEFLGTVCPGGTEFHGDHLSRWINLMGIICPGGQTVWDR